MDDRSRARPSEELDKEDIIVVGHGSLRFWLLVVIS